jgi:hypothetical protein
MVLPVSTTREISPRTTDGVGEGLLRHRQFVLYARHVLVDRRAANFRDVFGRDLGDVLHHGFLGIHEDMLAEFLQDFELLVLLQHEALKGERRFRPWPVQFRDEHPEGSVFRQVLHEDPCVQTGFDIKVSLSRPSGIT